MISSPPTISSSPLPRSIADPASRGNRDIEKPVVGIVYSDASLFDMDD
jgi:hypothetical protein